MTVAVGLGRIKDIIRKESTKVMNWWDKKMRNKEIYHNSNTTATETAVNMKSCLEVTTDHRSGNTQPTSL